MTTTDRPAVSWVLADRYDVGEVLGHGGMAEVRAGHDRRLDREVAVKLLRGDLAADDEARARFEMEARAAAGLTHPNIVAVFDSGEEDGVPYLVMERLPGRTLADELAAGPAAVERAIRIACEVLAALGAAHEADIVHRDVKPGNMLLTDDGQVKVADFGIAKATDATSGTQTGHLLATPSYVAPEQVAGGPASVRSDLYSLGVLLYEVLTGRPPFCEANPLATLRAIESGEHLPLGSARPDAPPHLIDAVERAMSVDVDARFASAEEMAAALEPPGRARSSRTPTVAIPTGSHDGETRSLPVPARPRPGPGPTATRLLVMGLGAALGAALAVAVATDSGGGTVPGVFPAVPASVAGSPAAPPEPAPTAPTPALSPAPAPADASTTTDGVFGVDDAVDGTAPDPGGGTVFSPG